MADKTKALERAPRRTAETLLPSRMTPPATWLGGFDLAAMQTAAGNMAIQRAAADLESSWFDTGSDKAGFGNQPHVVNQRGVGSKPQPEAKAGFGDKPHAVTPKAGDE